MIFLQQLSCGYRFPALELLQESPIEVEQKKDSDIFKSGGNILGHSALEGENKLFFSKFPPFNGNLIINNLF